MKAKLVGRVAITLAVFSPYLCIPSAPAHAMTTSDVLFLGQDKGRFDAGTFSDGSLGYVLGGETASSFPRLLAEAVDFSPSLTPSYRTLSSEFKSVAYGSKASDGTRIYGFALNAVEFDPLTGEVTTLSSLPVGTESLGDMFSSAVFDGRYFYVFGGEGYQIDDDNSYYWYSDRIARFDPITNQATLLASRLPSVISRSSAVWDPRELPGCPGGCAYIFGGNAGALEADPAPITPQIVRFNPSTGSTVALPARFPQYIDFPAAERAGNYIYIFGGRTATGDQDWIFRFDAVTGNLEQIDTKLPEGRARADTAFDGTHIYIGGGGVERPQTDLLRFDPATEAVDVVAHHALVASGPAVDFAAGALRIAGGSGFRMLDDISAFDPATQTLNSVGNLPVPMTRFAAVWTGDSAYLFGGLDVFGTRNQILKYSPSTGTFDEVGQLPEALEWTSAALHQGLIYVFGGRNESGDKDTIYSFDPNTFEVTAMPSRLPFVASQTAAGSAGGWLWIIGTLQPGKGGARYDPINGEVVSLPSLWMFHDACATHDGLDLVVSSPPGYLDVSGQRIVRQTSSGGYSRGPAPCSAFAVAGSAYTIGQSSITRLVMSPGGVSTTVASRGPQRGQITVTWQPPSTDSYPPSRPIYEYRIYRAVNSERVFAGSVSGDTFTFVDSGLPDSTTYSYFVNAVNSAGEGPFTAAATYGNALATTHGVPGKPASAWATTGPGRGQITFRWTPPLDDGGYPITSYRVYAGNQNPATALVAELPPEAESYVDAGLTDGQLRVYRVQAINELGAGSLSDQPAARAPSLPQNPRSVAATMGPNLGQTTVSWQAPASTGGVALSAYTIYRGTTPDAMSPIASIPAGTTFYVDETCHVGSVCFYKVTASNVVGEGPASSSVLMLGTRVMVPAV